MQRSLQIFYACTSYAFAVFQRAQIPDVQLHRKPVGVDPQARLSNVAQTQECQPGPAIVNLRVWYEMNAIARKQHSTEVFSVVIPQQPGVPQTRGLSQFTADQPGRRL